jgi:hypothetical protein
MDKKEKLIRQGKEMKEGGFREAYHSLPYKKMTEAKAEICRVCYWSPSVFTLKLAGKIAFRLYEIEQIEEFFKTYNLNAWTGDPLTV